MSEGETTGNIIRPPAFRGSTARERRAHVEKQRKQVEEQRGRELSRLRKIEKAPARGKKGPVFKKLGDRLIAARANGELVERARQEKGVSIQEIEERFGNRSDRYRLAPGTDVATREAREKADRRLMQQVRGYLRLAEAVAGLTGENADDLKLDVLRRTSLWSSPPRSRGEDADDERAERLALLVHAMAKHVIREAKLTDLFETLRRIPAGWHGWETDSQESSPWEIEDVRAPGDGWETDNQEFGPDCCACLGPGGYENSSSPFYPLPFPSVGLARLPAAELPVSVFSGERTEVDENDGFRGTLLLSRELRLVIGPTTSAARPGPMFESRPYVHLHGRGESYFLSQNPLEHLVFGTKDECFEGPGGGHWISDGKYWEFSRKNPWGESSKGDERTEDDDGLWANVFLKRKADDGGTSPMLHLKAMGRVRLNDDVCDPEWSDVANFQRLYWRRVPGVPVTRREEQPPSQHPPQQGEHWREVAWKPVDATHVSGMLDGPSPLFQLGHLPPFFGEFVECWFPGEESLVYNVERRLVTGDLERVLLATSERIRRALDRYVREWRGRLEARDARLIAGWSAGADEET